MAKLMILYWRDIPAQVIAETGRGRNREQAKIELSRRFAIAIDEAAMRDGAASTDEYLAEWRRGEPVECGDDRIIRQNVCVRWWKMAEESRPDQDNRIITVNVVFFTMSQSGDSEASTNQPICCRAVIVRRNHNSG